MVCGRLSYTNFTWSILEYLDPLDKFYKQQILKLREYESAFQAFLFNAKCPKMVKHTLELLQQMLQNF